MKLHYGWIICFTGIAVLFSCLGLGRFSLGMLLPSMAASLNLNYSQMGLIGTGNFVGYMISVILAGVVAKAIGARWTITTDLVLVGESMVLISRAMAYGEVMALYVATGIGSGLAIVLTGVFVPWVNAVQGVEGWRTSWLAMGLLSIVIAAIAALFLRNEPKDKGLTPIGKANQPSNSFSDTDIQKKKKFNKSTMVHLGCIYALFGATYVVYATFIVTAMVNERGFGENTAGTFWL